MWQSSNSRKALLNSKCCIECPGSASKYNEGRYKEDWVTHPSLLFFSGGSATCPVRALGSGHHTPHGRHALSAHMPGVVDIPRTVFRALYSGHAVPIHAVCAAHVEISRGGLCSERRACCPAPRWKFCCFSCNAREVLGTCQQGSII